MRPVGRWPANRNGARLVGRAPLPGAISDRAPLYPESRYMSSENFDLWENNAFDLCLRRILPPTISCGAIYRAAFQLVLWAAQHTPSGAGRAAPCAPN